MCSECILLTSRDLGEVPAGFFLGDDTRHGHAHYLWFNFSHLKQGNMSPIAQNQGKMDIIVHMASKIDTYKLCLHASVFQGQI